MEPPSGCAQTIAPSSRHSVPPLPRVIVEPLVRTALLEDLGRAGDITSDAIVADDCETRLVFSARQAGVVAGLDLARLAFELIDARLRMEVARPDGSAVAPGDAIAWVSGPARGILAGERTALNFLCHLSGIASATAGVVAAVRPWGTRVACTRKTLPGLRAVQKYAVRVGGGESHRLGLDDAVLVKDNHIAVAGGVTQALDKVRAAVGHMVKVEVEIDTLAQLDAALAAGVDAVLLDNMEPDALAQAVQQVAGRALTEASGGITPATAAAIAASGVDLISLGGLTQSATALDIGLDYPH